MKFAILALIPVLAATAVDAVARDRVDVEALQRYGGLYSSDCRNASAPRLRATIDALTVEQGGRRLTGGKVQAAHSFFGRSPPPNYMVALLSEVRGGDDLLFIVHRDRAGDYVKLDGGPKVRRALGPRLLGALYRRCDPPPAPTAAARPAPTPPAAARPAPSPAGQPTETSRPVEAPRPGEAPKGSAAAAAALTTQPIDLLKDPRFKTAYHRALGAKLRERWLARLDGPAPLNKSVTVAGAAYVLASVCKPRDCGDNNTVLLYAAERGVVYGKIFERGRSTLIGDPPAAVAAELDRLWRAEWRQG